VTGPRRGRQQSPQAGPLVVVRTERSSEFKLPPNARRAVKAGDIEYQLAKLEGPFLDQNLSIAERKEQRTKLLKKLLQRRKKQGLKDVVIEDNITGRSSSELDPRWIAINEFAQRNSDKLVSDFVEEHFPELLQIPPQARALTEVPPLPKNAERWPSDPSKRTENPAEFATRVYRVWMDAGVLTKPELKRLDPLLFASLENWLKHNRRKAQPDPLPEGFNLLTIEQANDAWIKRIQSGQAPGLTDPAEMARFLTAVRYRDVDKKR